MKRLEKFSRKSFQVGFAQINGGHTKRRRGSPTGGGQTWRNKRPFWYFRKTRVEMIKNYHYLM